MSVLQSHGTAVQELQKALDENERFRKGIQDYLDGNYDNARKLRAEHGPQAKCSHGRFYYEDCGECIDRHFSLLLGETVHATPEQKAAQ